MIALIASWCIMSFVFFTFGHGFISLFDKISKHISSYSLLDTLLIGLCVTATVIVTLSIWIPADTLLLLMLITACILYWLNNYKKLPPLIDKLDAFVRKLSLVQVILIVIAAIFITLFCTLHPVMTDTLYYHIQNIMWNEQYAVVPGLANLQPRFAFNSSYFLLCSTFGLRATFGQYIFGVHTLFLTLIYSWVLYKTLNSANLLKGALSLLMITCFFVIYKIHITSVTTDFIPNLLILYLVIKIVFDHQAIQKNPILYFLLPIFIVTLKLSAFAIAIIPMYILWSLIKSKQYSISSILVTFGLLIVIPWCARTIIMSGYLIFPFPAIDLFSFDWKIPIEYAIEQKEFIQSFARYPNNLDIANVLQMPISEWFPVWWKSDMFYYNPIANKVFFVLSIVSIPVVITYFFINKKSRKEYEELYLVWFCSLLGVVVWFFNAPDFRFIYSLILTLSFVGSYILLSDSKAIEKIKTPRKQFSLQLVIVIIAVLFVSLYAGRWVYFQRDTSRPFIDYVRIPSTIEYTRELKGIPSTRADVFETITINNAQVNRKNGSDRDVLCFDCELPCSADYVGGLERRGETLQEGYRCKPDAPHRLTY